MASHAVPLFLTPPARSVGQTNWRRPTGKAGRAVLTWSGYPQCRASSARGPPLTSLGVLAFWTRHGRQGDNGGWRSGGKGVRGRYTECAPHPAHAPSHACVRARDTGACNMPWVQQRRCLRRTLRESSRERPDGDGGPRRRRGRRQQVRGRTSARGRQAKKGKRRWGKQNGNVAIDSGWRLGELTTTGGRRSERELICGAHAAQDSRWLQDSADSVAWAAHGMPESPHGISRPG
jgi:hypothetical protein